MALAYLTWRFVEQPFRSEAAFNRRAVLSGAAAASAALSAFALVGILGAGLPGRLAPETSGMIASLETLAPQPAGTLGKQLRSTVFNSVVSAELPQPDGADSVAVWGDSYSRQLAMQIAPMLGAENQAVRSFNMTGCLPFIGISRSGKAGPCQNFNEQVLGNILALLGSWAVSFYLLFGREAQRQGLGIASYIVLTYSVAAIALLPLPLLAGTSYNGYTREVYLYILLLAIFPQVIGHTSFNWAVRWLSPTLVTLTILVEPIGSSILGFLVFKENPGIQVFAGAIVLLSGVAIAVLGVHRSHPAKPAPE